MKIGIDIRLIGKKRTGDEAVFFNLVKNLARIDDRNEYFLCTDIADQSVINSIADDLGIENKPNFKIVSLRNWNKFTWNFWTLPRYLRKNPMDIYLTQYITPFFVSRKVKIVTIIHDISFNFYPQFIKWSDLFFLKLLIPLSIKRSDLVLGVSEFTRDEIIRYYKINPEKVNYIHNAVGDDFQKDDFGDEKLAAVKKKYALPETFILYIGTMQPRKNIPFLIRSFVGVKDKIPGMKLVLAGNKNAHNFDEEIEKGISELGLENDVFFPGFIEEEDKAALFRLARVFAFPSLYEGFGIPLLEAFASEVPVVASDIPPFREVAGEGAVFFDPGSLDQLSKILYTVSTDQILRNKLIESGKLRDQSFSWKKTAEKTMGLFEKI